MKRIIVLALALILTACSAGVSSEFDKNPARWEAANITHYRYTLFIGCFCGFMNEMPLTIEVKDGEVVSMTNANGIPVSPTDSFYDVYESYSTIDRLFLKLESDLAGEADEVTVEYDPAYGFPVNIAIDQIKEAIDDELSIQISDFEVLE